MQNFEVIYFAPKMILLKSLICSHLLLDFFHFVFDFSRENPTFKTIDTASVIQLLPIVLDKNRAPHLEYFLEFLSGCNQTRITLDQWDSFLQFNNQVNLDLSNFEEDGACEFSVLSILR